MQVRQFLTEHLSILLLYSTYMVQFLQCISTLAHFFLRASLCKGGRASGDASFSRAAGAAVWPFGG